MRSEKTRKMKQAKGITLLALVITIVILIILAVVAISFAFGENGVVKYADKAKLDAEIDSARERLSLVLGSAYTEKKTSTKYESEEDFLDNYLDDYIKQRETEASIFNEDGVDYISLNGYIFELDRSVPQLGDYDGTEENRPPKIRNIDRVETDNPYSELSIEVTAARAEGATFKYSIKKEGEEYSSPVEGENTYLFTNLESKVKYTVKVELVINGEIVDTKEETAILGLLEDEDLEFGEVTWNSGKASITVSTATNKQIQYMIVPEGSGLTNWIDISNNGSITNIPNGALVSARLWDGKNASEEISRTIVDKTAPVITKFEVTETTYNSIAVQVEAEDKESGLATSDTYKFYLNDEIEERGISTDGRYKFDGLTTSETEISYKVRVEIYDNAENKSEKIIQSINTKPVIMKIETNEDFEKFRDIVNSGYKYEEKTVELMNDIDLQGNERNQWIPIGDISLNPENSFDGNFNGNYHEIKNLYINDSNGSYKALFGKLNGSIENLVVSGDINALELSAGIVANCNGRIKNCMSNVNIKAIGNNVGGITVAPSSNSIIEASINKGSITANWYAGGITSSISGGTIRDCYNLGTITTNGMGSDGRGTVGGIMAGINDNGYVATVENCYNAGTITARVASTAGGTIGFPYWRGTSNINRLINVGNVYVGTTKVTSIAYGNKDAGLLFGYSSQGNIIPTTCKALESEELKKYSNEELSELLSDQFVQDTININNGLPILKWQLEKQN